MMFFQLSKMKSISNIYIMIPYFDRKQISKLGYKYLNLIFLDIFLELLQILSSSPKFIFIFYDIMYGS